MNETTQYLAQLIGPITIILAISFALKSKAYMEWFSHIDRTQPYLFLQGVVEATVGLALVLNHNLWTSAPEIIISLLGWGMILEGTLALVTSNKSIKRTFRGFLSPVALQATAGVFVILGGYLTWIGYFA